MASLAKDEVAFPKVGDIAESQVPGSTGGEEAESQDEDGVPNAFGMTPVTNCRCEMCGKGTGTTRLLPMMIPYYGEVIVMSFECSNCGHRENKLQEAGRIAQKGTDVTVVVRGRDDLNRQIIKTASARLLILAGDGKSNANQGSSKEEAVLEVPPRTQTGITTVEGVLNRTVESLKWDASMREKTDPENAAKIRAFIAGLAMYVTGIECPFRVRIIDPAGNSYVENPHAPSEDPGRISRTFTRTREQNLMIGISDEDGVAKGQAAADAAATKAVSAIEKRLMDGLEKDRKTAQAKDGQGGDSEDKPAARQGGKMARFERFSEDEFADRAADRAGWIDLGKSTSGDGGSKSSNSSAVPPSFGINGTVKEVLKFATNCYSCGAPGETNMCVTDIPHFKEVVIMCMFCERCGYRTNEVKPGGSIPDLGTRLTLKVTKENSKTNLQRDVLKSNTARVDIPELELTMLMGTLGGVYTTVEGLLSQIRENLSQGNPFATGDSAPTTQRSKFESFLSRIDECRDGQMDFTLIISDPGGNSYVYSPADEGYEDDELVVEQYERSEEEEDDLGLLDMQVEGYSDVPGARAGRGGNGAGLAAVEEAGEDEEEDEEKEEEDDDEKGRDLEAEELAATFEPSTSFSGAKPGFVFKTGAKGLGYYKDVKLVQQ